MKFNYMLPILVGYILTDFFTRLAMLLHCLNINYVPSPEITPLKLNELTAFFQLPTRQMPLLSSVALFSHINNPKGISDMSISPHI